MPTTATLPTRKQLSRQQVAELRVRCQRDPDSPSLLAEAVETFLDAGLAGEALPFLRRLVALSPDNLDWADQLAALLAQRGEDGEALQLYRHVAGERPGSVTALHNLGVAACKIGDHELARDAFERKLALIPEDFEAHNDLAVLHAMAGRLDAAAAAYERCLTINPRYDLGRHNALQFYWDARRPDAGLALATRLLQAVGENRELKDWERRFRTFPSDHHTTSVVAANEEVGRRNPRLVRDRRIAFIASADTFLKPIAEYFGACNQLRVLAPRSPSEMAEAMRWADLTWLEWCDGYAIDASKLPRRGKVVCRLHSYEAFTDAPGRVEWANIDRLILVNRSVGDILDQFWKIPVPRAVIHNGVDPDRFPFVPPTARDPQLRKIGSVGYINYKKNPSLLLQTAKFLHSRDARFRLHVAGTHQDPRIKVYFDHLLPRLDIPVTFHGWLEDMPRFYAGVNYVISTSLFESFHYSIAEGMLSGCLPLVHTWKGAESLYPPECLFATPEEAFAIVQRYEGSDRDRIAAEYRRFIIERYKWTDRLREIDSLLHNVLTGEATPPSPREPRSLTIRRDDRSDADFGPVSVVIATRDNGATIADAVESVLAQTYRHVEIIVSDDGSTDDTESRLAPYAGQVAHVRQVRRGLAACLNHAIQSSHGTFIAILSATDVAKPDWIEADAGKLHEDPSLGMITRAPASSLPMIMIRRDALQQVGWFDETAPAVDGHELCVDAMMRRITAVYAQVDELSQFGSPAQTDSAPASDGSETYAGACFARWQSVARARSDATEFRALPRREQAGGCRIVFVGATDPDGLMAMWGEALRRHTRHQVRVLTHTAMPGYPSDLVISKIPVTQGGGSQKSMLEVLAEAETLAREADVLIFAAGLAPGALRRDARLEDADEQPYGTIHWPDLMHGKCCAALLFGTPSVRGNVGWYKQRFDARGWPILTCEPDISRWIPNATLLPRLIVRERLPASTGRAADRVAIVSSGTLDENDGGMAIREAARIIKARHPDAMFGQFADMPWPEILHMKRNAHVGIDRLSVGTGTYGQESLENSALGLVNITFCDPYARALTASMLGTDTLPWETPATAEELVAVLGRYVADPELLTQRMRETQEWFTTHWNEERLTPLISEAIARL